MAERKYKTETLLKRRQNIDNELAIRSGLEPEIFRSVHASQYGCSINTVPIETTGSGFTDIDGYEASVTIYELTCNKHGTSSKQFAADFVGGMRESTKTYWKSN